MKKQKICSNEYELKYWKENTLVCGIDEAGRGPLAGPLVTAGVVFPVGYENPDIYDSKAISEKKRNELYDVIRRDALRFEILIISEKDIDRLNIYRADQVAMGDIAVHLGTSVVLSDAMPLQTGQTCIPLIKGDQKSISIAAGSILAKVTRDRIMEYYDRIYPGYGFAKHKGYPTREHLSALDQYGITPIHRLSFGPVAGRQMSLDL